MNVELRGLIHKKKMCSRGGSNSRPSDYETDALPTELLKHTKDVGEEKQTLHQIFADSMVIKGYSTGYTGHTRSSPGDLVIHKRELIFSHNIVIIVSPIYMISFIILLHYQSWHFSIY